MFFLAEGGELDWAGVIGRNREALAAVVATLFGLLELAEGSVRARLPRRLYRHALRMLRPAEFAVRRLVVIAARGLVVKPSLPRPKPAEQPSRSGVRNSPFRLFDPKRRIVRIVRRIAVPRGGPGLYVFGYDPRVAALWRAARAGTAAGSLSDSGVDTTRLCRRLDAMRTALDDIPRQARRLARWRQRQQTTPQAKFASPLRWGHPLGFRRRPVLEVDRILVECHDYACAAMKPDTS